MSADEPIICDCSPPLCQLLYRGSSVVALIPIRDGWLEEVAEATTKLAEILRADLAVISCPACRRIYAEAIYVPDPEGTRSE